MAAVRDRASATGAADAGAADAGAAGDAGASLHALNAGVPEVVAVVWAWD